MQTWIKANIGKLIERVTKNENAIANGIYTNESDLDSRTTTLETTVTNISTTLNTITTAIGGKSLWVGTESAYSAIDTPDENTLYFCYADPTPPANNTASKKKKG